MTPAAAVTAAQVKWRAVSKAATERDYRRFDAVLQITESKIGAAPETALLNAIARRYKNGEPPAATLPNGSVVRRLLWPKKSDIFEQLESLRKAFSSLPPEATTLAVDIHHAKSVWPAVYAALIFFARLPGDKKRPCVLTFFGAEKSIVQDAAIAAEANTLARVLAQMPPNELTPSSFARFILSVARKNGLRGTVLTGEKLCRAGALLAVGRAGKEAPRVVRVVYHGGGTRRIAVVGKGVTFDTGGVNVKPARHMRGMKGDMAGAAAALAAVIAAKKMKLPVNIDVWLPLTENNISATAYRPDEVITALNGKRIEIIHTDAEGRMILADTLTLATGQKPPPDLVVSLATLTGTMHYALGERMSGFFSTDDKWRRMALAAADDCGERLCYFPAPADYRENLESTIADIKQCAEEGEADHIMAVLFLREFMTAQPPWLHVDLSAASCKGGLGAAPGAITGFGAVWALSLIRRAND